MIIVAVAKYVCKVPEKMPDERLVIEKGASMSLLYVTENGAKIGITDGKIVVHHVNGEKDTMPKETVNGISIFGQVQLTSALIRFCLQNGIRISFLSQNGNFYGMLEPVDSQNAARLKKQVYCADDMNFSLEIAKGIIKAKINNQLVIIRRYSKYDKTEALKAVWSLKNVKKKLESTKSKDELMGMEGLASRFYFSFLGRIVPKEFSFDGRSQHPAVDPFNAMLNYGYSMLSKEIQAEVENRGLNAYIGFLHADKPDHASLVSDMLEEWRAVIVDSVVLSLVMGREITNMDFFYEDGACRFSNEGLKTVIRKLEKKMSEEMQYLSYIQRPISFRGAIWHQAENMMRAVEMMDSNVYAPIYIR